MSKLLTKEEIFNNPKETIKFLCFDNYITLVGEYHFYHNIGIL